MHHEPHMSGENQATQTLRIELALIFLFSLGVFILAANYDILEWMVVVSRRYEAWEFDEMVSVAVFLVFALSAFSIRRWIEFRRTNAILSQRNQELHNALIQIKELKGIIPICSACKKIRDDHGFWHQVEIYIETNTDAEFTHGICPECTQTLYPDWAAEKQRRQG